MIFIMINIIIIIFYKVTYYIRLTFNLITIKYFDFFYAKMLTFLFIKIYYNINKYQNRNKVKKLFDKKIV